MLLRLLGHPLTRGLDPDDPHTTLLRRRIIQEKAFLRRIYREWYEFFKSSLPSGPEAVLELGSGGGFLKEVLPNCLTSEVLPGLGVDLASDARALPFRASGLRGIVMVDVFHHIPDVAAFLKEATRCLRPGGVLAMIEPWNTCLARLVYRHAHPEPFDPNAGWFFPETGPLSGANGALPWIVFQRDREAFATAFPELYLESVEPDYPFVYLASGGVSLRAFLPGWCYPALRGLEELLAPLMPRLALFARIIVRRRS